MSLRELERGRIIPDVVETVNTHSKAQIAVTFGDIPVVLGENIDPKDSSKEPHVSITGTEDHAFYTLICTDPDAPDPANPTKAEFVHWIVTNIQKGDIKSGDKVLSYVGPAPPTGVHRYVFLLYKQSEKINFEAPEQRILFKVAAEAEKYYLGDPEAVIYFTSKKDK